MRLVALTGSVAAGKSTVASLFRRWGARVIDADQIVRDLQRPGEAPFAAIVARFGAPVLRPDGTLNREQLRHLILADPAARADLEAIVHPAVEARRRALLAEARAAGVPLVVVDIPLLFEAADPSEYDDIIVVDAPVDERRRRLIADRGLSPEEAAALIAAQWPAEAKRARATWVIDNDGDRDRLETRTREVWEMISR